jgi:hypothetical protein
MIIMEIQYLKSIRIVNQKLNCKHLLELEFTEMQTLKILNLIVLTLIITKFAKVL